VRFSFETDYGNVAENFQHEIRKNSTGIAVAPAAIQSWMEFCNSRIDKTGKLS
jgi:hypothetical protein